MILSKRLLHSDVEPLTVAFWDCLVGALAVAPGLLFAGRVLPRGAGEWAAVLLLGIVFTGLSTLVYAGLLRHVTAQAAGILTFLEPVAAGAAGMGSPRRAARRHTLVGGALVLLAGIAVVDARAGRDARHRGGGRGRIEHVVSAVIDPTIPDRNLALELVRVTEAGAMGAARWIGRGDKNAADQAAVDLMRRMINTVVMQGVVVIGEGEKDEAPMLFNGERVGAGWGPEVDVAVDPLEGTRLTALGMPGAISVIAVAERGSMFFPGAALYMNKIAVGPEAADAIDLNASPTENVKRRCRRQGHAGERPHGRRARARPPRRADRRAARCRGAREPDPRRRRRAVDRRLPALHGCRHADGHRRDAGGRHLRGSDQVHRRRDPGPAVAAQRRASGSRSLDDGFDLEQVLSADDLVAATTSSSLQPASRAARSCAASARARPGSRPSRS